MRTDNRNVPGGAFVPDDNIGATDKVPRRRVAHNVIFWAVLHFNLFVFSG